MTLKLLPTSKLGLGITPFPGLCVLLLCAATSLCTAQTLHIIQYVGQPNPLLLHSSAQGYLGVNLADVDQDHVRSLKLKDTHGALVTLIDHDAPAGKIGLHVDDVILQINGQAVEGSEQLRRVLHEIPAGHKVQLVVSRDGQTMRFETELTDRKVIAHTMQEQIQTPHAELTPTTGMGVVSATNPGDNESSAGFFRWWTGGASVNVGASVEPLTAQMADSLGLSNGLMVKAIVHKSDAESAGLRTRDIILKLGDTSIQTTADWERALHSSLDKPVTLVVLRDKKQIILTLTIDTKHHKGANSTSRPGDDS